MSYEDYRAKLVSRLVDKLPTHLLTEVMSEVDMLSSGYSFEHTCTDLITVEDIPEAVKMYLASMAIRNCSMRTLYTYKNELMDFFHNTRKPYNRVTADDIRCFLFKKQTDGCGASYRRHMQIVINAFFGWLVNNDFLTKNPAKNVDQIKVPKRKLPPLKQIELEQIRSVCQSDRERALVDFLFSTGCRISEAANGTIDDIDWNDHSFIIRHGKGDKERVTYFNAESELSLKRYLSQRKSDDRHLFLCSRRPYNAISIHSLEKMVKKIKNRVPELRSKQISPHTLRRTMGTLAVERGCPIEKVKELLGHESLDTTMRYVTVSQSEIKQAHNKYLAG